MDSYFVLIDGVSKFIYHSFTLACLKFDFLRSVGYRGVSIMDGDFNVLRFADYGG